LGKREGFQGYDYTKISGRYGVGSNIGCFILESKPCGTENSHGILNIPGLTKSN
jgi:hypothetical protein